MSTDRAVSLTLDAPADGDVERIAVAVGEQLHLQTRRPRTTLMLLVGAAIIGAASERLPLDLALAATPLRIFLALYAICLVGATATIGRGVHHPAYLAFNLTETVVLTAGVGLLIVAGGTPHSLLWLIYFSTVMHGAHGALYRRFNYAAFSLAPVAIAVGFALRRDASSAALSLLLGATALYLYRLLLAASDRRNAIEVDRARLRRRLAELAVVEERERIARDLHDGLGANLTAALWQARRSPEVPAVADIEQRLLSCLDDLGALVWATRRDDRRLSALWSLLRARCDDLFGEQVHLEYGEPDPADDPPLAGEAAVAVLFLVFEAVRNAARHGRAQRVCISVRITDDGGDDRTLTVEVRDDGVGFDPATITPGHGLRHMAERARGAGGTLALRSRPGETVVSARMPVGALG